MDSNPASPSFNPPRKFFLVIFEGRPSFLIETLTLTLTLTLRYM